MLAPETEARSALIKALEESYPGVPVVPGKLHIGRGQDQSEVGIYPERIHHGKDALISEMFIAVQYWGAWERHIDILATVDPTPVEEALEALRIKLRTGNIDPRTGNVWYFMLEHVDFPPDPVGGITRYLAHFNARGDNTALLETK